MPEDIILVKAWCWWHLKKTWHILRIDGVLVCLECRLHDNPVYIPLIPGSSVKS